MEKHNAPRWSRPLGCRDFSRYSLLASLIAGIIIERTQSIVNAFWCLLLSNWPDGTVQTQSGCTIPAGAPLCGDCGNGFRFPPGQARTQGARLTDFCGAAAPQHRRGALVSRVWGRHSPTSSRPGEQMSGAKFGPRVDTCSHVTGRHRQTGICKQPLYEYVF